MVMLAEEAGAVTRMVSVAEAPLLRLPTSQLTIPADSEALPVDGVADWKVVPGGKVSVTLTPEALAVPLLVTVTV